MTKLRHMPARDPDEVHRTATPLELFFDLVAVIAIASVTASFHHAISAGHGVDNLLNFLFVFTGIWWAWMNYTWFATGFDNDDPLFRLFTIVIMAGFLEFAAGVEYFFENLDFIYSLFGWVIMRVGMIGLWLRAARHNPEHRTLAYRNAVGLIFAQTLWVIYVFAVPVDHRFYMVAGGLIFLVEFLVPVLASRAGNVPWHRHHIIERYGLLNTIVLGEVLLSISLVLAKLYSAEFDLSLLRVAFSALVIVFGIWWLYFLEDDHLRQRSSAQVFIWGYLHLLIFLSGALLAAGLGAYLDVLTDHSKTTAGAVAVYINLAVAIYLGTLWLVRDRLLALGARAWVLPGAVVVLIGCAWTGQGPEITALVVVGAVLMRVSFGQAHDAAA